MNSFDWIAFLHKMNVEYVEVGPNVARDHVNIACPFCREDPSHHMGISLEGKGWGCWRDESHRGAKPERLVMVLARCSWQEAQAIVEDGVTPTDVGWDGLRAKLEDKKDMPNTWPPHKPLLMPDEFFPLDKRKGIRIRFLDYLEGRGFPSPDERLVAKRYRLAGAVRGDFKERLILPVFYNGDVVGWTGRAINRRTKLRYKAHPPGETLANYLFNYDSAFNSGGRTLVICEGPMDALKVDFYGKGSGIRAVALMGLFLPPTKLALLANLTARFDTMVLATDDGALHKALDFSSKMQWMKARLVTGSLPDGVKDPGDLEEHQVLATYGRF